MEKLVYTVKEVAALLSISETVVYNLRNEGKLHQLPIPGVKFNRNEVEKLAGLTTEFNIVRYKQLQTENERLQSENRYLRGEIRKITSQMLVITGDLND